MQQSCRAKTSFRPHSKCRSTSQHNGAMKRSLPAEKAQAGRYAPVTPHVNLWRHRYRTGNKQAIVCSLVSAALRELASFSSSMRSRTPGRFIHLLARKSASLPAYVPTIWRYVSDPVNPLATIAQTSRGGGWMALASQCFVPVFFGFGTTGCLGCGLAADLADLGDDLGIG